MVLVAIKNSIFGGSGEDGKKSLLPVARSYETVCNADDDEENSDTLSTSSYSGDGFVSPRVMSDIIIGLSDGLTVPFALTAGLSSLGDSKLVITGGMAELVSGAISMGLGGYLAAKSESEYYENQVGKETLLYNNSPYSSTASIHNVLAEYNLSPETIKGFVTDLESKPEKMIDFIIRFGRGLEEPADGRQLTSALTIGMSYFFGGFIPLIPYFFTKTVEQGLIVSVIVMLITLFAFGAIKTLLSLGSECGSYKIAMNGLQMVLTGGAAAGAAWGLVKAIE